MKKILFLVVSLLIAVSAFGKEYNQAYEEKLIQDLKGIYTQGAVKTSDNPTGHPVCATSIILQAKYDFPNLSPETQKVLSSLLSRPPDSLLEYTYDSPGGYFKIHFAKDGVNSVYQPNVDNNGNGVPDFVDNCASILDHVWAKEVDTMGYIPPPSDGWYPPEWDNGGDGKYDIYLLNLGGGYLGATYPEESLITNPNIYTSFIELDNDYLGYPDYHSQYEWLSVTAAHEFFHTIQLGYDAFEYEYVPSDPVFPQKTYWMEMSATWMEDQVFDDINDYVYYLPSFFNYPWLSLRTFRSGSDLHPYGSCVWPIYLGERYGIEIIKDVWTKCAELAGDNVLVSMDTILKEKYGSSLSKAFQEFSVWNYFTADRANPSFYGFYSEGNLFYVTGIPIKVKETAVYDLYPVLDTISQSPENLGTNYLTFIPTPNSDGGLGISFYGDVGVAEWAVSNIDYAGVYQSPMISSMFLDSMNRGAVEVCDWDFFPEISLVVARGDTNSSKIDYSYEAEYDTSLHGCLVFPQADKVKQNFPNPFVIKDDNSTTKFPVSLASYGEVKLFIFSVSGELIWDNTWETVPAGDYDKEYFADHGFFPFEWNGKNKNGEYVASGIYIYQIVTGNTSEVKKMVVVNER
jgi:hypothetical protein